MAIKRLKVSNFKSFNELDLELGDFNVLIGANASGKSNFVSIFEFLRDIANDGLENAISLQGDADYLLNFNIKSSKELSFEIDFFENLNKKEYFNFEEPKNSFYIRTTESKYNISIDLKKLNVTKDILFQNFKCFKGISKKNNEMEDYIDSGSAIIENKEKLEVKLDIPKVIDTEIIERIFSPLYKNDLPKDKHILENQNLYSTDLPTFIKNIAIYDFEPKSLKHASRLKAKAELEVNGGNLFLILKKILNDTKKKRKFLNLLEYALPFIKGIEIRTFTDEALLLILEETYFDDIKIPPPLTSNGTIYIIALLVAIYMEDKPLVIIEEPEKNIHPHLIFKLVEMLKDASRNKQIIISTHNPEIVKYAGIENLFLVSRDENGFSKITKPSDRENVKTFLSNEIGIDELYIQNLLEV
ncbi:MAG: AAA family ATPase [Candidatus Zixiibacteriota bacterium]